MKFSKSCQIILVTSFGLLAAIYLTACGTRTIDFVYVASSAATTSGNGQIQPFAVDSLSGALRNAAPAVSSGGPNPIAEVTSPDYKHLYVANQGNSTIVHFAINSDSSLTVKDTLTLTTEGNTPVAVAVNAAGTFLYVLAAYQPGCNSSNNCSGALSVYSLSGGTIGSPLVNGSLNYWPLALGSYPTDNIVPTGLAVIANGTSVYVSAYDQSTSSITNGNSGLSSANPGYVYAFAVGSNGLLAAGIPFAAGIKPSAVAADPSSRFVYVTDFKSNELIGYQVAGPSSLNFMHSGPFKTGDEPSALVIDPRGFYIYVTNSLDNTLSAFSIGSSSNGIPSTLGSGGSNVTDPAPVALTIEPSLGRFVYTANLIGNSITGFRLNPDSGILTTNQASPYPCDSAPTAIVSVPHGNYALQVIRN